jgi:3-dehydroquinate synthase
VVGRPDAAPDKSAAAASSGFFLVNGKVGCYCKQPLGGLSNQEMIDSPSFKMNRLSVHVNLARRSYDIVITTDEWDGFGAFVGQRVRERRAFIITDEHVRSQGDAAAKALTANGFRQDSIAVPAGETQKSLAAAAQLYDSLAEFQADRQTLVVAVGGGVIGDLAGFVAATYVRGLPLLMVPTTLLAMVDSSVGGKTALNHPRAKNLIGAFHQPIGVWIDTALLATLPDREYRSGLAEVVKYGVILDEEFFRYLENHAEAILDRDPGTIRHVVARCCGLKADIVERDEREESGLRAVLNYGHTFAHAFETAAGYGSWLHGEAVSAGMVCAGRLAQRHGLIPKEVTDRQQQLLVRFGLPTAPEPWSIENMLAAMRQDKKSLGGRMRFVLPRRLGNAALIDDIPEEDVREVLAAALT